MTLSFCWLFFFFFFLLKGIGDRAQDGKGRGVGDVLKHAVDNECFTSEEMSLLTVVHHKAR